MRIMLTPKADFPCGVIALMSRTVAAATLYRELLADITKDCGFAVLHRYFEFAFHFSNPCNRQVPANRL
jgi:hypothetical protein